MLFRDQSQLDIMPSYRLIHIGQFLNGLGAPVAMGGPPLVSSTWFPPTQRATATAISTLMSYVGISVSFLVGPFILNPSEYAQGNDNHTDANLTLTGNKWERGHEMRNTSVRGV